MGVATVITHVSSKGWANSNSSIMDIRQIMKKAQAASNKKKSQTTRPVINDDDDDDFKENKGKRRKQRKLNFDSDSEDEVPAKKSKRTKSTATVSDYWSAPIKRSNPVKSTKLKHVKQSSPDVILESPTDTIEPLPRKHEQQQSMDTVPLAKKLKQQVSATVSHQKTQLEHVKVLVKESPRRQSPRKSVRQHDSPQKMIKKEVIDTTPPPIKGEKKQSITTTPQSVPKLSRSESYRSYLDREGPKAPGSKEIPKGAVNCLVGLTFVFTGVGESLDKDQSTELAKQYGGRVTSAISSKTTYLVTGEGAGESKLAKAKKFGTKVINEDDFLELIRSKPAKTGVTTPTSSGNTNKRKIPSKVSPSSSSKVSPSQTSSTVTKSSQTSRSVTKSKTTLNQSQSDNKTQTKFGHKATVQSVARTKGTSNLMWVDKYSPITTKQIIGQQGNNSNVKKLARWLREWFDYHGVRPNKKIQYGGKGKEDGSTFKAVLLSGPPGIGKTTSATLVCKEEGFKYTEMNASACRGKSTLQSQIAGSLSNLTMDAFITGGGGTEAGKNHVLIMDEVDGMAGNEDRGGIQELIKLIKGSHIPIICICNDRQHTKIRSLANSCYDLRFHKPKLEQIKGSMMSIAFKEGVKINPHTLQEIIIASNNDIRQVLHNMSLWTVGSTLQNSNDDTMMTGKKDFKRGPFDVIKTVFLPTEGDREYSLNEKAGLFFQDYSFIPLFVQENYLRIKSQRASNTKDLLQRMSDTADSIAKGDLVSKLIRAESHWGLLPLQAMYSSVLPGEYMRGALGRPEFPQWLGNNSKHNKYNRILQEIQLHTRLVCSCNRTELIMDYLPLIHSRMTCPLVEKGSDGVSEVISLLECYNMAKDDWDNMVELVKYSGMIDVLSKIDTKTKSAFTRTYNKSSHILPYQSQQNIMRKKTKVSAITDEEGYNEDEMGSDEAEESDDGSQQVMADKLLVKPKKIIKSSENKNSKNKKRKL